MDLRVYLIVFGLVALSFIAGFFVGGKWKVKLMNKALTKVGTVNDKFNEVRKIL